MISDIKNMTISQLTTAIIPFIVERGYSEPYVEGLRQTFNHLNTYCDEHGLTILTAEVAQNFLHERYGIAPGTAENRCSRQIRAMDMLLDFYNFGAIMTRRKLDKTLPEVYSVHVESYLTHMKHDYAKDNTLASHRKGIFRFTDFISSRGVADYKDLKIDDINAYVRMTLCNYAKSSAQTYFGILRCFLRYLFKKNVIPEDLSNKVISSKWTPQASHLPSTLTQEQIESILACVDRESPMGKRDYAILLLATRLGLRASDIRDLKASNFNWEEHELCFTQVKTGEPLVLPIPNDVGWAVIDYLKNARPTGETLSTNLFLKVIAPYEPLQNLDNVLIKYMREAKIPYKRLNHHGLHILRHSLATHMLDEGIDIATIQSVLGHLNIETTRKYTGVSVRQMKECGLEVLAI